MQVLNASKYKMLNDPMIVRILFIFIYNINQIDIQKILRFISIPFLYLHIVKSKEIKLIYTLDS